MAIISEATLDYAAQEAKMDAWHAGKRQQNLNMSSEKMELNYNICIRKGYSIEARMLLEKGIDFGYGWALKIDQASKAQAQKATAAKPANLDPDAPLSFSPEDFTLDLAQFIKDNIDVAPSVVLLAAVNHDTQSDMREHIKWIIVYLVLVALIDKKSPFIEEAKKELIKGLGLSLDYVKLAIRDCYEDPAIVEKLTQLMQQLKDAK